ncbi:hypothetical protein PV326_013938 [Microctonus aethiopoides]|nr:hypothetical protein PV326_013938 [Microctonus aethiopoides]
MNKNIQDEIPRRPKLPAESKNPRKPSSFPKLPRPTPRRPKKPPPPFPGDLPTSTSKKSQKDSPITYIRPFKKSTTPQPPTTENPDSDDEKPDNEDDNSDENPTPPPTRAPKRKPGMKNLPKASGRPRGNITPVKTTNRNNKATKRPPVNCNESLPESDSNNSDDVESPKSGVKTRPRNPTKQRPIKRPSKPENSPSYTNNNENSNTTPNADESFDLTSRITDTDPDTQQPENTGDTPKTPSDSSKRPQNPKSISPPDDTYRNNPFLFPPFDSSFINGFASTGTANSGASATASASSNTGVPAWSPWPNFFPNRFNSPPMFSNNPFINIPNSPDDQQRSNSPSTPDSSTNNNDPTENQPIKNNLHSSSSSQLEPKGYTPVISISGSFDPNEHSVSSRSSFPSSDPSSDSPNDHDSQINFNAPSHGPMGDPNFNPFSGQMPDQINPNSYNGYPSTAGGFASASSFSSAGAGGMGSSLSSSMYDGEPYPRNYNNNGGFPANSEAQIGSNSYSNPNWVNDQINSIQKQIQDQQKQMQQSLCFFTIMYVISGVGTIRYCAFFFFVFVLQFKSFGFPSRGYFGGEAESQQFGFPSDLFGYQQPQQPQQQYPSFPSFSNDPFQSSAFGNLGGNPGFGGYNGPSQGLGQPGAFGQSYGFASASSGQPGSFGQGFPNFQSRFPDISPSGGSGSVGSFSSSKTVTEIGPDGKPVTHEVITTGTTKDGKTSVHTYKSS